MKRLYHLVLLTSIGLSAFFCAAQDGVFTKDGTFSDGDIDSDTDADGDSDTDTGEDDLDGADAPDGCGDGILDDDEACDDGNRKSGDGCAGNCLSVEDGYSCNPPGLPCHRVAICGDGVVFPPELCDDENLIVGDGCDDTCKVEIGWSCEGAPSSCFATTCGDGIQEGAESCDDGNAVPFDGCSAQCQKEPDCSEGPCKSECGDGLVLDEECDDGNSMDGDGCSATCLIEDGFTCPQADCEDEATCTLKIAAVYRDFLEGHSDFAVGCSVSQANMVETTLDDDWKPVLTPVGKSACVASDASFREWYTKPVTLVGELVLFPDGQGNFVNRYGENGEAWIAYCPGENAQWVANDVAECAAQGCVPCPWNPDSGCTAPSCEYDGNPLFFPLDGVGSEFAPAKIPAQYGYDGWPWEEAVFGTAVQHNFSFTSEVTYWFQYDETKAATLNFTGDDDVWVFVNGELAVDLGGVHPPEDGSVTIGGPGGKSFGMEHDKVYRINVFHAERKQEGSSFKLTLGGFNTARSACRAICGDGVVALGEQCDDGVNDGGYGECDAGCVLGEYCGDGIVQSEYEDCDDGNFISGDGCPSSCRRIGVV